MRTLLLALVTVAVLTTPAVAYDYASIGLFVDEARTEWCLTTTQLPYAFDVWIYCRPSENGVRAVEFSISDLAPTYYLTGIDPGPTVSITLGNIFDGISYSLYLCETDWFIVDVLSILATGPGQTAIWLQGHGDTGVMAVATCLPGYPLEPAVAYSSVFVNYPAGAPECSGVATEETSWGAIKDMFK